MALAGWIGLTTRGGARTVNVTVTYQDSSNDTDGVGCTFTDPSDVSYSFPNGLDAAGQLKLTLAKDDPPCYEMANPGNTGQETGHSVTFTIYRRPGAFSLVGVGTTIGDTDDPSIDSPVAVSGTLTPVAGIPAHRLVGVHLFNALGGTTDTAPDGGHMALGGRATLNAKGGANALDLTLSYVDSQADNFTCELTNPADLSYSVSKGVGALTLTVSDSDSSCPAEAGKSISFNFYSVGGQTRLIATSSSLTDSAGDVIDSAALSGSM